MKFLGLLLLVIVVSLAPELIGGDLETILREKLGDHYFWIIAGTALVTILVYTLWSEGDKIFKKRKGEPTTKSVSQDNLQKIRAGLLESYQERLKSKLAARFPINLELKYSTEGTSTKADIYDNKTIRSTKIKEELIELFDKHRGRLLIIGEPGAGKTTLLLQLAEQLMEREERQIPVVINMATWRGRFSSVEEWLRELLPQMGFSKGLAVQFLKDDLLLPLFDGLDELEEKQRKSCLEAIGEYGRQQEARYVICSRIVEYVQTVDAPVYCQVMVKPLTLKQIKEGLQEVDSPETNGILDAMKKDKLLAEAIKTPFYLNTVQLLFSSAKAWEEFGFKAETLEGRQNEIIEFFVADAVSSFEKYSAEQVKKWLGFLADRMEWKGLVEFELVSLQYDWAKFGKRQVIEGQFLEGLIKGLGVGMIVGSIRCIVVGLAGGKSFDMIVGLVSGISVGLVGGLGFWLISMLQTLDWNFWPLKLFIKQNIFDPFMGLISFSVFGLAGGLVFGLAGGLVGGIVGGIVGGVISALFLKWLDEQPGSGFGSFFKIFILGLFILGYILIFALVCGLIFRFVGWLEGGFVFALSLGFLLGALSESPDIFTRDSINWSVNLLKENIYSSLWFGLIFGLFFGLTAGLDAGLILGLLISLLLWLSGPKLGDNAYLKLTRPYQRFEASFRTLHFSILQHYHLRRILRKKGFVPKKLVSLLQKANSQNLLESDGGSWRFRHRILQEYFANHWKKNYEDEADRALKASSTS